MRLALKSRSSNATLEREALYEMDRIAKMDQDQCDYAINVLRIPLLNSVVVMQLDCDEHKSPDFVFFKDVRSVGRG